MKEGALLPEEIIAALARGATVLTGNERAARTLRGEIDRRHRAAGLTRWEPPTILSWNAWTGALWSRLVLEGQATRLLLNGAQEHGVWRRVIAEDAASAGLRSVDSLAELAMEAWQRLAAYRGEALLPRSAASVDTQAFARWAGEFDRRCRAGSLLPAAQLETALESAVAAGQATLAPAGYLLTGFDRITPAQAALLEAVRAAAGLAVEILDQPRPTSITEVASDDLKEELATAARWIRRRLQEQPHATIALIVPGLESCRAEIDRALRRTLAPEQEDLATSRGAAPFEFSLGVPLASTPLASAALDLLRWAGGPLEIEQVSALLLSPHLAAGAERTARAEFDAYELRRERRLRPEITLESMVRAVGGARRGQRLPRLLGALKAMSRAAVDAGLSASTTRSAADWADAMRSLLEAAGWPGESEDSIQFQTRRKWEGVLDELATLDFEGVRFGYSDALTAVTRLAQAALFAPESRGGPVQVMGPLESAGSNFDAVWFLRAGDQTWPARAASSPLLAWPLRHALGMPGSDAAEDAAYGQRVTERIAGSARVVFFSYARVTAEGTQRPSAALHRLVRERTTARVLLPPPPRHMPLGLEAFADTQALPPVPDRVIQGGATVLRLQAACGFRAFAERRLWATALGVTQPGMDPREQGTVVHATLEHFWREVGSQATLRALSNRDRRDVLGRAIETALARPVARCVSVWDAAYLQVQRERLVALLDPWLLLEMRRQVPFTVKLQESERRDAHIGPLRLTLRVDRIDETEFGDVILDYKTGVAKPSAWLGERPDEPQLPLYAVLAEDAPLAGIAFAQVRAGEELSLHGYEIVPGILPSRATPEQPTLEIQREAWHRVLTSLAEDFHAGDARVRPKSYPVTCQFCSQRILCRLDVSLEESSADDAAEVEVG